VPKLDEDHKKEVPAMDRLQFKLNHALSIARVNKLCDDAITDGLDSTTVNAKRTARLEILADVYGI
jgi:hypothetical protein